MHAGFLALAFGRTGVLGVVKQPFRALIWYCRSFGASITGYLAEDPGPPANLPLTGTYLINIMTLHPAIVAIPPWAPRILGFYADMH